MWKISKNRFFGFQKFIIMVPKMVPQWYPKCLMVPKMVPKWYPNSLTHFFKWWFFIIFQVQKMATWPLWPQFWVPSRNFGYHRYFFRNTYHVSYLRKKRRSLSRDIYLPSLIFLIFHQIYNFHLWDKLHFLGTIEYSMVPKNFTIVKYEVSAF